jgi:hypothetical protein
MFGDEKYSKMVYAFNPDQQTRFVKLMEQFRAEGLTEAGTIADDIASTVKYLADKKVAEDAAAQGESTIPKKDWGVHEHHCCLAHGCKYGNPDCPVAIGLIKQKYRCESCDELDY